MGKQVAKKKPRPIDSQISSTLRELWMRSEPRRQALVRSRIPCLDGSRKKWLETCEQCGKTAYVGQKEHKIKKNGEPSKVTQTILVVHHLDEVPNVWHPEFMKRLFCSVDRLQVVCHECHDRHHALAPTR